MKFNKLSNTDISVSEICLGTMTFGEQNSEAESHAILDCAIDNQINFIDTAEMYAVPSTKENFGKTEEFIGSWIKKTKKRDQFILATKVTGHSSNLNYIANNLGFSKSRIHNAIDNSLRKLNTDYVDLYQLHWPERKANFFGIRGFKKSETEKWQDNMLEVAQIMNGLIDDGKIRHWGLSNETPWGTMRYLVECDANGIHRPVSIQNPYNLLNRTYEVGMAEISYRENIGLLVYSPMAFGLLSGKYHLKSDQPDDRMNKYKELSRYNSKTAYVATDEYLKIAQKHDFSLAQMSLAYINTKRFVTSNIIGVTTIDQLKENIASKELILSSDVIKEIELVHDLIPNPAP
ncbi:MAG: aldo/keto reductase [Saprospiraceae bacterium]